MGSFHITFSLENAVSLGLVTATADIPPVVTVVEAMLGQTLTVDPSLVLETGELVTQPVAVTLGDFLSGLLGVDGAALMAYHEQGLGFGEIAQAGFMALALNGDSTDIFHDFGGKEEWRLLRGCPSGWFNPIQLGSTAKSGIL